MRYSTLSGVIALLAFLVGTVSSSVLDVARLETQYKKAWEEWKQQYNKNYDNVEEESKRFSIFISNMKRIDNHNADSSQKWQMKINQFGDLTRHEYKDIARCAKIDDDRKIPLSNAFLNKLESKNINLKDLQNPALNMVTELPDYVDWTTVDNIVTPVKNQGECGACWAFATTGNMESRYAISNGELNSLSEQELIDCAGDDSNCNGGYSDMGVLYGMWNYGLSLETDYPYTGHNGECRKDTYKHFNAVDGLIEVERYNSTALMAAVVQGPVIIGIDASYDFEYYSGGIFDGVCGTSVDHMVLIVGYNKTGNDPYWKIKNSWGDNWGEDGYVRMCMDCDKNGESGECCVLCYPSYSYFF